jgi:predicted amidohydrolase YtcJ
VRNAYTNSVASFETSLLLTGARVFTADPAMPWAEALVTRGNRLHFVGSEVDARERVGEGAEEIQVPGGLAIPGLNDSHIHMSMGAHALTTLNLEGAMSVPELQARLRAYAAEHPDRPWIEGYGLSYEPFLASTSTPSAALDAAVSDRPVFLYAFDTHTAWCNSAALMRGGIEHGADLPLPNEVVVDEQDGATGVLKERLAHELVRRLIASPPAEELDNMLVRAMQHVNRLGITSVQNMDGSPDRLQQYDRLHERGDLTVRAYHYLNVRADTPRELLRDLAGLMGEYVTPWNRMGGIKLFIDGVVEAKTALMLEPYADGRGAIGVPDMDPDLYLDLVIRADALGMDVATHAIGDRGSEIALDAYGTALEGNGSADVRHRIEHIEVLAPHNTARFRELGVTASMQPLHAAPTGDPQFTPWTALVGPQREPFAFAWQSLLTAGASLSFGSDWPVVSPDVRLGLHTAMMRADVEGEPPGGWQPQQSLTLSQALNAYTTGAAYAEREEGRKGTLAHGMLADITVFERDLFTVTPAEIPSVGIALTIVDGRVVHRTV